MTSPRTTPSLTAEILADGEAVAARIDQLLRADPQYRQRAKAILNAQDALRRVLSNREWQVYMDLEAAVNARLAYALSLVVGWAFDEGQEHPACAPR